MHHAKNGSVQLLVAKVE